MQVAVIDSGGANIGSVLYALERLGARAELTADPAAIRAAPRVILPGVGAAAPAMAQLRELGLVDTIRALRQPLLGICLGMQLLFEGSDEGDTECLGLLRGRVRKLPASPGVRVPHMGWNALLPRGEPALLQGVSSGARAYFVHSYAAPVTDDCIARCEHGEPFAAMAARGNVAGAQFHPERSAATGARILANFLA
jgi:imidazole glycerol-phosphate synthase subunit HisH